MSVELLLTLGVLLVVFGALVMDLLSPDAVLLGGLVVLVLGDVIDRVGGLLQVLLWIVLIVVAPFVWPM